MAKLRTLSAGHLSPPVLQRHATPLVPVAVVGTADPTTFALVFNRPFTIIDSPIGGKIGGQTITAVTQTNPYTLLVTVGSAITSGAEVAVPVLSGIVDAETAMANSSGSVFATETDTLAGAIVLGVFTVIGGGNTHKADWLFDQDITVGGDPAYDGLTVEGNVPQSVAQPAANTLRATYESELTVTAGHDWEVTAGNEDLTPNPNVGQTGSVESAGV